MFKLSLLVVILCACAALIRSQSALYGQCGGQGWAGPTTCVSGSNCVYNNDYYSQCLPVAPSSNEVALYGQCGGHGWAGSTNCVAGSTCSYINDYYSQCLLNSNPTTTIQTTTQTTAGSTNQAALYGQCGGQGWTGATNCVSGANCVYNNQWYSQCLPSNNGQVSSTAAPTASSTPSSTASSTASTSKVPTAAPTTASGSGYSSKGSNFINNAFKVGIDYNYATNNNIDWTLYDYITIWMNTIDNSGSTAWNPWYQGAMLDLCKSKNKIPLFYAYVIAFEARAMWNLQDCDVSSTTNLCQRGSEFIRKNRQHLVEKYTNHSREIANKYGKDNVVVFVMEPDFWQYFGDTATQQNGTLSGTDMRDLFNDFVSAIKTQLPNALISWDISAWIGQDGATGFKQWWSYFKDSQIDFIHTSGGQAHGELANIKPNELTWSFVSSHTGKKIIADCGYGVAGGSSNNCGPWSDINNENARISDGVVALSITTPGGTVQKTSISCC